jgi:hypothetical protein
MGTIGALLCLTVFYGVTIGILWLAEPNALWPGPWFSSWRRWAVWGPLRDSHTYASRCSGCGVRSTRKEAVNEVGGLWQNSSTRVSTNKSTEPKFGFPIGGRREWPQAGPLSWTALPMNAASTPTAGVAESTAVDPTPVPASRTVDYDSGAYLFHEWSVHTAMIALRQPDDANRTSSLVARPATTLTLRSLARTLPGY